MRRLILKSFQSPGDIVMLTAAVRDLHRAYPGQFQTDVRTSADALFEHNPWITKLSERNRDVQTLTMHYPLIHQSNQCPNLQHRGTLDRDGLVVANPEHCEHLPTTPREVYDITGAGDMVLAICGYGYAAGWPLGDTATLANVAAGLEVERFGVEPVNWAEIDAERTRNTSRKVCTLPEAVAFAETARCAGQRVVFTNGCFDLFHAGHLRTIEEAAAQGEVLIVAVNSDASVRRLKGPGRPIVGERQRAAVIAALSCVDRVVVYDDDTPHRLLKAIRPNVLVKGGSTGNIVGHEVVEAYRGRVLQTAHIPGISTTAQKTTPTVEEMSPCK